MPLTNPSVETTTSLLLFFKETTLFPAELNTSMEVIKVLEVLIFHIVLEGLGKADKSMTSNLLRPTN